MPSYCHRGIRAAGERLAFIVILVRLWRRSEVLRMGILEGADGGRVRGT
jgi:hypothetical protein